MTRRANHPLAGSLALLLAGAVPTASGGQPSGESDQEIMVEGQRLPIIVTAPPRCRPRRGDPLDAVDVSSAYGQQQVIKANRTTGAFGVYRDDDPITGPQTWQRAGSAIRSYVFRAPLDGNPLCIGARSRSPGGWGQLRRVLDASAFRGRYVRFTAFVATRNTAETRLWLAAGDSHRVMAGGDTRRNSLRGTNGWTPIELTIGPVPEAASKLSYGFLLYGEGDVWMTDPVLETLDEPPRERARIALVPVGSRN